MRVLENPAFKITSTTVGQEDVGFPAHVLLPYIWMISLFPCILCRAAKFRHVVAFVQHRSLQRHPVIDLVRVTQATGDQVLKMGLGFSLGIEV